MQIEVDIDGRYELVVLDKDTREPVSKSTQLQVFNGLERGTLVMGMQTRQISSIEDFSVKYVFELVCVDAEYEFTYS